MTGAFNTKRDLFHPIFRLCFILSLVTTADLILSVTAYKISQALGATEKTASTVATSVAIAATIALMALIIINSFRNKEMRYERYWDSNPGFGKIMIDTMKNTVTNTLHRDN